MNERNLTLIATLGVLILGVFGPLIAWFCGNEVLQGNSKETVRQMLNFEITLAIIAFLAIIPFVGLLVALGIFIANITFAIKSFCAVKNNTEFKAPGFEFIK